MTIRTQVDRTEEALAILAGTTGLGPTARATILAVIALETIGAGATPARVAATVGVTERTFRYRTDGEYLKRLVAWRYLRVDAGGYVCLGDKLERTDG